MAFDVMAFDVMALYAMAFYVMAFYAGERPAIQRPSTSLGRAHGGPHDEGEGLPRGEARHLPEAVQEIEQGDSRQGDVAGR